MKRFAAIVILLFSTSYLHADVKLPAIFGDHMVVQRGMKIPVWGWADPGEKVIVKAAGQSKSATTNDKGRWRVTLDQIKSSKPIEITIDGKNSITIHDVLVGEVWLCSGQSNMGFELRTAANAKEAIAAADHPTIRLFTVEHEFNDQVQDDVKGKWEVCSPQTVPNFSAVAYFFGLELQQKLNGPVGLIHDSWGGTRAEAWIPKNAFDDLHLPYEPEWTDQWLHPAPTATTQPKARPYEGPAALFNAMIAPIATYAMRGVIWYQGETNTAHGEQYAQVMTALIKSWRRVWGEGDFPFLIVQISSLEAKQRDWTITRQAQTDVARDVPKSGLVVTIDVGNPHNIHPTDKLTVGKRLSLVAEKVAYGQRVEDSGPTFKSLKIQGNQAIVTFDHVDGGLVSKANALSPDATADKIEGFEIAGADGNFVPATAKIDGDKVIASSDEVAAPKAVRYAWENAPKCSLYNKDGLPAVPFKS